MGLAALFLAAGAACNRPAAPELVLGAAVPLVLPAAPGSGQPHLATGADGTVVLSWLEPHGEGSALRYAVLDDRGWQEPRTVASGDSWFVNWADFPSVTPIHERLWAAHWLVQRPGGTYAYDVAVALSLDNGASWRPAIAPHSDGTATEHGFVSLFPMNHGVGVLWLDGRNMARHDATANHQSPNVPGGGMSLRSARLSADMGIQDAVLVDGLVCDCCQTDVAVSKFGPIAAYRDRTEGEIRDIAVARHIDGAWQPDPARMDDGWKISGCPVNGPAIAADGLDVVVAWFTAAGDRPRVRAAFSVDGGATFGAPIDIDSEHPLGRVDVELIDDESAVVSWIARSSEPAALISARTVARDGTLGAPRIVAATTAGSASGFPQMIRREDTLVFAWTDVSSESVRVATAMVEVSRVSEN